MGQANPPTVTLIIPVRNEEAYLPACLDAVLAQDYPHIIQILLVDGMSTDRSREIIADYAARDSRIQLLDNPRRVVTHALNIGLQQATGDVIVRLDAHADYAPDYVSRCVEILAETGAGNVGGPAIPTSDGSLVGDLILALHTSPFGIGAAKFRQANAEGWVDSLWPGAFRRQALQAAGMYFVEELTRSEDIELNDRIRRAGWGIYLSPKIRATYHPRKSLVALCRQNAGNGAAVMHTLRARRRGVRLRHLAPLGFVAALLLGALLSLVTDAGGWVLAGVGIPYAAANLTASLLAARRHGLRILPVLPGAFLLLHLAYGFGSLAGMVVGPRRAFCQQPPAPGTQPQPAKQKTAAK